MMGNMLYYDMTDRTGVLFFIFLYIYIRGDRDIDSLV